MHNVLVHVDIVDSVNDLACLLGGRLLVLALAFPRGSLVAFHLGSRRALRGRGNIDGAVSGDVRIDETGGGDGDGRSDSVVGEQMHGLDHELESVSPLAAPRWSNVPTERCHVSDVALQGKKRTHSLR